jgi:hypothetical protein
VLWAPPGRYTVTTAGDLLVNPVRIDFTVTGPPDPQPVELQPTLRPGLHEEINRQIRDHIDQCAAQRTFQPAVGQSVIGSRCPFTCSSPYTITDRPQWIVKSYPTITLQLQPDGTVPVTTTAPGRITLTYRWSFDIIEPRTWTTETITEPLTIGGHAAITDNTVAWKP